MITQSAGLQAYPAGPPGKSAYQVAVDNGFSGSEAAWLASLQGAPGVGVPGAPGAAGPLTPSVPITVSTATAPITAGTTYVGITSLTGSGCSLLLPLAASYQRGASIDISDETGICSATLPIVINANSGNTISGSAALTMASKGQLVRLVSNGYNLWTTA